MPDPGGSTGLEEVVADTFGPKFRAGLAIKTREDPQKAGVEKSKTRKE